MKECCNTCNKQLKLEKCDYSNGGCEHTDMEGFLCLAFAYEGIGCWMVGLKGEGQCEVWSPREE